MKHMILAMVVTAGMACGMENVVFIEKGKFADVARRHGLVVHSDYVVWKGLRPLLARKTIGSGDFKIGATLRIEGIRRSAAAFKLGNSYFGFEGANGRIYFKGDLFEGVESPGNIASFLDPSKDFVFEVEREKRKLRVRLDRKLVVDRDLGADTGEAIGEFGFVPIRSVMYVREFSAMAENLGEAISRGFTIPQIDLNDRGDLQTVITPSEGKYWGHPSSVLLEDGRTMVMMYLDGHARAKLYWKKSFDGGRTWTGHLPVPEGWNDIPAGQRTAFMEVPILYRMTDPAGKERIHMFTGVPVIRRAYSEDGGNTWSKLEVLKNRSLGGIVVFADMLRLADGSYMGTLHDDGRFMRGMYTHRGFSVYKMISRDGGMSWDDPVEIAKHPKAHLCEAGLVRSPDGKRIAMLMRENARLYNSFISFSGDEGKTWSKPQELPGALTGDRHQCTYVPDGRLFVSFRDRGHETPTPGDWVGWVGTFEDVEEGREGQYRVRLKDNHKGADCAYPTQHLLHDGTVFAATYGHWTPGEHAWIIGYHFKIEQLDELVDKRGR